MARYLRRLASFSRLIMFDKRGIGMSDRVAGVPTLEERIDDVGAVMAAAGSARAAVCGISEGGAIGAVFAATYPERVTALILLNSAIKNWLSPDLAPFVDEYIEQGWGSGRSIELGAPSVAEDERVRAWAGRIERLSASPATMAAMVKMNTSLTHARFCRRCRVRRWWSTGSAIGSSRQSTGAKPPSSFLEPAMSSCPEPITSRSLRIRRPPSDSLRSL